MIGSDFAHEVEAVHAVMELRGRERLPSARAPQRADCVPRIVGRPDRIGVVADVVADAPGVRRP